MIENIEQQLNNIYDKRFHEKLVSVLSKNTGYSVISEINNILRGNSSNGNETEVIDRLTPSEMTSLDYVPLVSCDVERMFSQYKSILADNRRKFSFENLKYNIIIKCNPHILQI